MICNDFKGDCIHRDEARYTIGSMQLHEGIVHTETDLGTPNHFRPIDEVGDITDM